MRVLGGKMKMWVKLDMYSIPRKNGPLNHEKCREKAHNFIFQQLCIMLEH